MVMGVLRHLNYFKGWHRTTPSVHQHPPDQRKTKIGRNSRRSVCVCVSACVRCKFCQWMLWWNVSCHLDGVHYRMPNNKKNIFDERENWKSPVTQTANCNIVYLSRAEIAAAIRSTFSFFSPTLSHFLDIIFRRRRRCCFFLYFFSSSSFIAMLAFYPLSFIIHIIHGAICTYEPKLSGVPRTHVHRTRHAWHRHKTNEERRRRRW